MSANHQQRVPRIEGCYCQIALARSGISRFGTTRNIQIFDKDKLQKLWKKRRPTYWSNQIIWLKWPALTKDKLRCLRIAINTHDSRQRRRATATIAADPEATIYSPPESMAALQRKVLWTRRTGCTSNIAEWSRS